LPIRGDDPFWASDGLGFARRWGGWVLGHSGRPLGAAKGDIRGTDARPARHASGEGMSLHTGGKDARTDGRGALRAGRGIGFLTAAIWEGKGPPGCCNGTQVVNSYVEMGQPNAAHDMASLLSGRRAPERSASFALSCGGPTRQIGPVCLRAGPQFPKKKRLRG